MLFVVYLPRLGLQIRKRALPACMTHWCPIIIMQKFESDRTGRLSLACGSSEQMKVVLSSKFQSESSQYDLNLLCNLPFGHKERLLLIFEVSAMYRREMESTCITVSQGVLEEKNDYYWDSMQNRLPLHFWLKFLPFFYD